MTPPALVCRSSGRWLVAGLAASGLSCLLAPGPALTAADAIPAAFTMAGAYAPPEPSWSPDGKQLAFTVATAGGERCMIYKVNLSTGKAQALCPGAFPSWSPQGGQIALVHKGDLYVVPAGGGPARRLGGPVWTDNSLLAWSPDGRQIAFQKTFRWSQGASNVFCGEVCVAEAASGKARQLTRLKETFPADAYQQNADVVGWLPGSEEVVVNLPANPRGPAGVYAVDQEGRTRLLCEGVYCRSVSPDGKRLVGMRYHQAGADLVMATLPAAPRVLRVFTDRPPWRLVVSWAERIAIGAGRLGSGAQSTYALTRFDLASDASKVLTATGCYEGAPALSPDGLRLAFYRHAQGKSGLFVMRADGQQATWVAACQK